VVELRHRKQFKVSVGDGGQEPLLRRMRAQANFIEHAPFFLILLAALELAGARQGVLVSSAVLFILSRIAHAYGMDGGSIAVLLLCLWAILCAVTVLLGG
jgi:uncharacterized membrane protein YecN with MAPEG domain